MTSHRPSCCSSTASATGHTTPGSWLAGLANWEACTTAVWANQHGVPLDAMPGDVGDEPFHWKLILRGMQQCASLL